MLGSVILRSKIYLALFALSASVSMSGTCVAGGRFVVLPGVAAVTYQGWGGYASNPFDDGYDYPFGYGEYAEYGPWAYRGYGKCYVGLRKVRTSRGWHSRPVRTCD